MHLSKWNVQSSWGVHCIPVTWAWATGRTWSLLRARDFQHLHILPGGATAAWLCILIYYLLLECKFIYWCLKMCHRIISYPADSRRPAMMTLMECHDSVITFIYYLSVTNTSFIACPKLCIWWHSCCCVNIGSIKLDLMVHYPFFRFDPMKFRGLGHSVKEQRVSLSPKELIRTL